MINRHLKTDKRTHGLLIEGKLNFLIQDMRKEDIQKGEVLSYTDRACNDQFPEEFLCHVVHIEVGTEGLDEGFAAIGFVDISKMTESQLMGLGFTTAEQRAALRTEPWQGIGLLDQTQDGISEANHWKTKTKEWMDSQPSPKRQEQIDYFMQGLINQFINEDAAKEFLART